MLSAAGICAARQDAAVWNRDAAKEGGGGKEEEKRGYEEEEEDAGGCFRRG